MKNHSDGLTLIEVMLSMFILTISAFALIKLLLYTQYTAEDNLYEATALTVAISTIEQMKGANWLDLTTPKTVSGKQTFYLMSGNGKTTPLFLDETNVIEIPITTDESGEIENTMALTLTPRITATTTNTGYWLEVEYTYDHPKSGRSRTQTIRNLRTPIRRE